MRAHKEGVVEKNLLGKIWCVPLLTGRFSGQPPRPSSPEDEDPCRALARCLPFVPENVAALVAQAGNSKDSLMLQVPWLGDVECTSIASSPDRAASSGREVCFPEPQTGPLIRTTAGVVVPYQGSVTFGAGPTRTRRHQRRRLVRADEPRDVVL
jgi:hypothetical protein